ncbi:DUF4184 family protein [Paenibacillus sp. J2TS4]|uniref:DUF4184 family protein n=1 Tax=Paenibacillus sp. J2TS4 TaxID=2807194 RepID=UPI001BCA888E|nr:DUF4184 family protein [Paenibacillus sp. J2TS4]
MPYTLAHPITAIVLKRLAPKSLCFTGLVMGSMAPDFEYFIKMVPIQTIGHSFLGLLVLVIPLSIILSFLFHYLIKKNLALHLPSPLNQAASVLAQKEWRLDGARGWGIFLLSVVLGFLSHLFLDSLTDSSLYLSMPFIQGQVTSSIRWSFTIFMQYILSIIFLSIELIILIRIVLRTKKNSLEIPYVATKNKIVYWSIVLFSIVMATFIKVWSVYSTHTEDLLKELLGHAVEILMVAPFSGMAVGIVIASIVSIKPISTKCT